MTEGERLAGGNVGGAWRVGDTVRRAQSPASPAIHALLDHLADKGLRAVPRFLGVDDRGREILDFLPGRIVDVDREELTDAQLASLVAWARDLHAATADFHHPGPWRLYGDDPGATCVAHNDLAPYNVCFDGDALAGVFDWDLAAPATPRYELGFILWNCVPLYRQLGDGAAGGQDWYAWAARRVRLVAETYGGVDPADLLDACVERIGDAIDGVRRGYAAGDPGMINLVETCDEPARTERALERLVARLPRLRAAL